ncbi:hypothetical protein D4764_16G0009570 [Takifugu flavidus]|uniref:Protein FAM216A n=1 Tax=Takifugu flavidus TaxID=433684 RepID=A0A5C6P2S6_9TELE|nr:hypothetical protein D4764_16G0009570 [Takifugu flavidus]
MDVTKRVRFAVTQKVQRRHQDEDLSRTAGTNESQTALTDNTAARLQQDAALPIPGAVSTAPFLKHTALTPAQREYLCNIAASHSDTHVRGLITQHYMNVLHRCTPSGGSRSVGARADGLGVVHGNETQAELCPGAKVKNKKTNSKRADRSPPSFRPSNASIRRKKSSSSRQRATIRLLEEEELDASLGLLCIAGRDDACSENVQ